MPIYPFVLTLLVAQYSTSGWASPKSAISESGQLIRGSISKFSGETSFLFFLARREWKEAALTLAFVFASLAISTPLNGLPNMPLREVVLTTARGVHDLAPGLAQNTRVHLIGTITYYVPAEGIMFLQDSTGGVYINNDKTYPVHKGDLVEVDGFANASYRTEVANNPKIRVLGRGQHFATSQYSYGELVAGQGDCELVRIRGKVRAADIEVHQSITNPSLHLDVVMPEGEIQVYVDSTSGFQPDSLLDATVEITGVAGGAFDAKYQLTGIILYVPEAAAIRVLKAPAMRVQQLPLTPIDNVFQSRRAPDTSRRLRVRGTVTYYTKGDSAVLENGGKSIYVQSRQDGDFSVGDVVDAIGYASDREYAPSLRQATLFKTGAREEIAPRAVNYTEASSGMYSDNLVSMTGVLVSRLDDAISVTLVLKVDGHLIDGYLQRKGLFKDLRTGSRVRIVGVCRIVSAGPWRAPSLSHLEMRSVADAQLISKPPWYTVRHLVESLTVLIVLAFAIAVWAVLLKGRVSEQAKSIKRSMRVARERSRILEMISSNRSPDVLLPEICRSLMGMLPGTSCSYSLDAKSGWKESRIEREDVAGASVLFEVPLVGNREQVIGRVVVSAANGHLQSSDQNEVFATLSELVALAMQQSLLYQGLVHHSTHDSLTELPNRRLCESRLGSALDEAKRLGSRVAVIYIDVNGFKHVNDRYGHKVGDQYLRQISARLSSEIRAADTLARVGGDEFLVVTPYSTNFDHPGALVVRLQTCFEEPFLLEGESVHGSASFGLARYPEHGTTAEELRRNADHAMYISKSNMAGATGAPPSLAIISTDELELALIREQFRLAYQPQFSAKGRLTGMEALLRLQDPILGCLTPDAFISVAERHAIIIDIGAWVLRRALQDAVRWHLDTGEPMVMAVNVSIRQLAQHDFADSVLACLKESAFPADRLELELIERSLVSGGDEVGRQLKQLRQAGVRISLDDFGTGQSCLSMLHKLPIDTIKIDRSFILALDDEPRVLPIIQAIAAMAHSLGKRIVAEGIEHVGPIPALLETGEMEFQGYLLSQPVPAQQVDLLIATWRSGIVMPDAFHADSARQPVIAFRKRQQLESQPT